MRLLPLLISCVLGVLACACAPAMADATAPTVQLTSPDPGATVSGDTLLGADAADADGVTQVKWYVDGVQVTADRDAASWSRTWDSRGIGDGPHRVFAKAVDASGNWATSPAITITVANGPVLVDTTPPTISISSPNGRDDVTGMSATLAARAFDDVGVTRVKWYVDGTQVGFDGDGAPWTRAWDTRQLTDGEHRMFAKARDDAGNWGSSPLVVFSVRNAPCGTASAAPARWDHVVWIVFENKSYSQVVGSPSAPYLNALVSSCGLASDYHGIAHPSLPNYIAMVSGSTQGITDDSGPAAHPLAAPSIFSQLGAGGWRALQESMPGPCNRVNSGLYAARHNPALYFTDLGAQCATQDVPLGPVPDVSARFTFITPDLCHDMHSSPCAATPDAEVAAGDGWLAQALPAIFTTPEYRSGTTAVFITWDEDDFTPVQHIPTMVVAPSVTPGTSVATTFDHYSLLRTTEEMLGLDTYLGEAANAQSMRAPFGL